MNLKSGSYKLEVKDVAGAVKCSSRFNITDSSLGSSGGIGGVKAASDLSGCTVVNLFY
jgi:hypothetical protein